MPPYTEIIDVIFRDYVDAQQLHRKTQSQSQPSHSQTGSPCVRPSGATPSRSCRGPYRQGTINTQDDATTLLNRQQDIVLAHISDDNFVVLAVLDLVEDEARISLGGDRSDAGAEVE